MTKFLSKAFAKHLFAGIFLLGIFASEAEAKKVKEIEIRISPSCNLEFESPKPKIVTELSGIIQNMPYGRKRLVVLLSPAWESHRRKALSAALADSSAFSSFSYGVNGLNMDSRWLDKPVFYLEDIKSSLGKVLVDLMEDSNKRRRNLEDAKEVEDLLFPWMISLFTSQDPWMLETIQQFIARLGDQAPAHPEVFYLCSVLRSLLSPHNLEKKQLVVAAVEDLARMIVSPQGKFLLKTWMTAWAEASIVPNAQKILKSLELDPLASEGLLDFYQELSSDREVTGIIENIFEHLKHKSSTVVVSYTNPNYANVIALTAREILPDSFDVALVKVVVPDGLLESDN